MSIGRLILGSIALGRNGEVVGGVDIVDGRRECS